MKYKFLLLLFSFFSFGKIEIYSATINNYFSFSQDTLKNNKLVTDTLKTDSSIATLGVDSIAKPKYYYGMASFYSKNLEGSETSTQETFRHNKLTCASNRFKLNTWLRVTNISNNKSIIVRVNDRMHPRMDAKGRIVDLSYLGAKKLNFIEKGTTKVKVEIVAKGIIE